MNELNLAIVAMPLVAAIGWQDVAAALVVLAAVAYVVRAVWLRLKSQSSKSCGGCGTCATTSAPPKSLVSLDTKAVRKNGSPR